VRPGTIESHTWAQALDLYGTDKPTLRFAMLLARPLNVFVSTEVKAFAAATVRHARARGAAMTRKPYRQPLGASLEVELPRPAGTPAHRGLTVAGRSLDLSRCEHVRRRRAGHPAKVGLSCS